MPIPINLLILGSGLLISLFTRKRELGVSTTAVGAGGSMIDPGGNPLECLPMLLSYFF